MKSKSQKRREAVQKKAKKDKRKRYFGTVKLPKGVKFAWLSNQNKHGWSLGFALDKRTVWLRGLRFATKKEIHRALDRSSVVYVQLKDNKVE